MRKYGKYEKRPEKAKKPEAKSAILQTYFTSLLCLVLCVSMFFGTSFAWFTSEVNNVGNEIYIGTLDVGLYKKGDGAQLDMADSSHKLFDSNVRWEPGYTAMETLEIVNEGDLAFKYVLNFTEGAVGEGAMLNLDAVAKHFDVWFYNHKQGTPAPGSFQDIAAQDSGWKNAGTLDQILAGAPVLDGQMTEVREAGQAEENIIAGTTDGKLTTHTYSIALHMNEEADASVMGHKISLSVKLVAYQLVSEQDDFGNGDYDKNVAYVDRAEELKTALEAGGEVVLTGDIELKDEQLTVPAGVTVNLHLNGHSIVYTGENTDVNSVALINKGKLTVNGDGIISGGYAGLYSNGDLTVNGGTFLSENGFGLMVDNIYGTEPSVATINGGTFTGVGVYNPAVVTVNGGAFNEGRDPDGASDHISDKITLFVSPTFTSVPKTATVILNGGTFNGDIYVYDDGGTETVFEKNDDVIINGEVLDNG